MKIFGSAGITVVAGFANAFALAWPLPLGFEYGQALWGIQWVAMLVFCSVLVRTLRLRDAVVVGYVFQFSTLFVSLSWLQISMAQFGGLHSSLAWAAVLVLAALLALYGAAATALCFYVGERWGAARSLLLAVCWMLTELARGQWLSGFGWASIGYAHVEGPFSALAPWVGVYGIGALVTYSAAVCALLTTRHRRLPSVLILLILLPGLSVLRTMEFGQATQPLRVELLQGNIAQDEKFEMRSGVAQALTWYGQRLQEAQADLALAPETAIPLLPQQLPPDYWRDWPQRSKVNTTTHLIGIPLGDAQAGYTNSVVGFRSPEEVPWYRYDKYHLVPFGEFIPPFFRWFVRMMHIPLGDFERGNLSQAPVVVRGERIAPGICFEDLFAEELAARFRSKDQSPTILANFSNLAWFGNSTAMYQHLHISRMRSIEFARPSLRVSNTGVTAVVDHSGRVVSMLPPWTQGVLTVEVQGRSGLTPFAWWCARWGQIPLWIFGLVVLSIAFLPRRFAIPSASA